MDMRILFPTMLLIGCGASPTEADALDADATPVTDTVQAIQPGPMLDLVHKTAESVGAEPDCPRITLLDASENGTHERWDGGCTLQDGTAVMGSLERFEGLDSAWIAGSDFRILDGDRMVFGFDGAVEVTAADALWLMDAAASVCGTEAWDCADGPLGMDLTSTIYPASGFPDQYSITVSGAVATDRATLTVDGAWSVDRTACAVEPTTGAISIRKGELHALTLDGATACDACAAWEIQGQPTAGLCGLTQ